MEYKNLLAKCETLDTNLRLTFSAYFTAYIGVFSCADDNVISVTDQNALYVAKSKLIFPATNTWYVYNIQDTHHAVHVDSILNLCATTGYLRILAALEMYESLKVDDYATVRELRSYSYVSEYGAGLVFSCFPPRKKAEYMLFCKIVQNDARNAKRARKQKTENKTSAERAIDDMAALGEMSATELNTLMGVNENE